MMAKSLTKLIIFLLPLLILIATVNYNVDPGNLFKHRSCEKEISYTLATNYNAAFDLTMSQVDEVSLLELNLARFIKTKDIVVIGSSRLFSVNQSIFPRYDFYNASVSSCRIGDMLGIFNLLDKYHQRPKVLLLEMGPDFLILNPSPKESLFDYFVEMLNVLQIDLSFQSKIQLFVGKLKYRMTNFIALFSPAYFQESLKYQRLKGYMGQKINSGSARIDKLSWHPTFDKEAMGGVIFPDGSRQWALPILTMDAPVKANYVTKTMLSMERLKLKPMVLRDDNKMIFEKFLEFLIKEHIQTIIVLPPYHPTAFDYETTLDPAIITTEDYIIETARRLNIPVVGSLNPHKIGFTGDELIDNHHLTREGMAKLLANLH